MIEDTPQVGLLAGGQAIPLEGVKVTAEIKDCLARVVIFQRYANREAQPIEAVYVFPLDERAACCGFEAVVGDTHLVGEVKEREQAFADYDDALAAGHGAYLLDEERADVFTASLGNVPPGQEVLIRLTYVTELDASGDGVRFVLPTTVSPRYAPEQDRVGVGRPPAETVNPPLAWSVPYGLELELELEMPSAIRSLESPSHPLKLEVDGARARVRLGERSAALDRDFVLEVKLAAPAEASRHVEAIQADMGGTEILPALEAVFAMERAVGLPRQLVVLTDGEVSNTDAVIALIRRHSDTTRVFAFGIGAGASHHLVRGISRAGEGAAEFIAPGERIDDKVLRQFGKLLAPALSDVALDWGSLRVQQAPHRVPPVFAGGRLLVYGFVEDGAACDVSLRGSGPAGPFHFAVKVDPAQAVPGRLVGTLAARSLIRDLEEGASPLHDRRGSLQKRTSGSHVKDEIVRLAMAFGLVSRETSFVAVERRATPTEGEAQLRRVPVALTRGWGGLDQRFARNVAITAAPMAMMAADCCMSARYLASEPEPLAPLFRRHATPSTFDRIVALQRAEGSWELSDELMTALGLDGKAVRAELARHQEETAATRAELEAIGRRMERTIRELQGRLAGFRELRAAQDTDRQAARAAELAGQLHRVGTELESLARELERLRAKLAELALGADPRAVATRLALEWLQREAGDRRHQWELLAEKAGHWLDHA